MRYGDYVILQHETMTELVKKFFVDQHLGKSLFREKKANSNVVKWDIVHQSRNMADYVSPDGAARISGNMKKETQTATVAHIREKRQIKGTSLAWLRNPGTENQKYGEQLIREELEDLNKKVERRKEWARWKALSGTLTVDQEDVKFTVDYQIAASHKPTVTTAWSDIAADIIGDLSAWKRLIEEDSGENAKTLYINSQVMEYLCKNTSIRSLMNDPISARALQEGVIKKIVDIDIVMYSVGYVPAGGSFTKFIPDEVAILTTAPGFARELTAPSTEKKAGFRPGKFSKSWEIEDPAGMWMLVDEQTLPVIERVENIVYADLTP